MVLEQAFTRVQNLDLALARLLTSQDAAYKSYFRDGLAAYRLAGSETSRSLAQDLRNQGYEPRPPRLQLIPKRNGSLRPISILSLADQHVYQAVGNIVANKVRTRQQKLSYERRFSGILAGQQDQFLFRSWRVGYARYRRSLLNSYQAGNRYLGEFDLVSFYDTISHDVIVDRLAHDLSPELVSILRRCLRRWASADDDTQRGVGLPQGPETSTLLAELMMFELDELALGAVTYARYADDIRIMATSEAGVRRAMLQLEVAARRLGFSPKAWHATVRRIDVSAEIGFAFPSQAEDQNGIGFAERRPQRELRQIFRDSAHWNGRRWNVTDEAGFKFSLPRMNPNRRALRRGLRIVKDNPHLSWVVAQYARNYPDDATAADLILDALEAEPPYSFAAGDLIEALDTCEPSSGVRKYRSAVRLLEKRCVERGERFKATALAFRASRAKTKLKAAQTIVRSDEPLAMTVALHRVFAQGDRYALARAQPILEELVKAPDADLARSAGYLLVPAHKRLGGDWVPGNRVNESVKELLFAIGLRGRRSSRPTVLDRFFRDRMSIGVPFSWRRALGSELRITEQRCLRFRELELGDPTSRVHALDIFNEVLIRKFATSDPALAGPYRAAVRGNRNLPDIGNWLENGNLQRAIPRAAPWFLRVHRARSASDLAHDTITSGTRRGERTRRVIDREYRELFKGAQTAWADLITAWEKLL